MNFIERDISWLSFNERVLQEAKDPSVPLYERIKFLAIFSSNLDEFFRVRVASIRSFRKLKKKTKREMELKPRKLLKKIRNIVEKQQTEFGRIFNEEIIPELAENDIYLLDERQYTTEQKSFALNYFSENIQPDLEWELLIGDRIPFLENKSLYLLVAFKYDESMVCIKIPDKDRFIVLPSEKDKNFITFVDDIMRVGLMEKYKDKQVEEIFSIKMSRDAEMYIDDEFEGDLLEKIKNGLKERDIGLPTRFLYDSSMSDEVFQKMKIQFGLTKNDLIPGGRYHNFNDFFGFPDPTNNPNLQNLPFPPLPHPQLEGKSNLLELIAQQDFLIHFPYQKFEYTTNLINEIAQDPQVEYIKITLYRVASKSEIGEGLLAALNNGKKVTVFIEAKARFDEKSNLHWGNKLSQAGANVRYSFPGIKVHTKILLIGRRENENVKHYTYVATGNFNEKTSKIYSDFALMTADPRIADEIAQVFDMLEGRGHPAKYQECFSSPTYASKWIRKTNGQRDRKCKKR